MFLIVELIKKKLLKLIFIENYKHAEIIYRCYARSLEMTIV